MSQRVRWIVIAFAAAVAILGGVTVLKVNFDLKPDWAIIRDIFSAKLRLVTVGDCSFVYDRDTGALVEKICKAPLDLQTVVDDLRKQIDTMSKDLEVAQREASKVPQLQAEAARQKAAVDDAVSKLRQQLEINAAQKRSSKPIVSSQMDWINDANKRVPWQACMKREGVSCEFWGSSGKLDSYECNRVGISEEKYLSAHQACRPYRL